MDAAINDALKSKVILRMFPTYMALRQWLDDNKDDLRINNLELNITTFIIKSPNGSTIILGYEGDDPELLKFRGLELSAIYGWRFNDPILTRRIR